MPFLCTRGREIPTYYWGTHGCSECGLWWNLPTPHHIISVVTVLNVVVSSTVFLIVLVHFSGFKPLPQECDLFSLLQTAEDALRDRIAQLEIANAEAFSLRWRPRAFLHCWGNWGIPGNPKNQSGMADSREREVGSHPDPSLTHNGEDNILGPLTPIQILLLKDPLFLLVMRLLIPTPYHRFSVRAKPKIAYPNNVLTNEVFRATEWIGENQFQDRLRQ